ncbi:MAG: phasin family protein [Rhizobacter sp.]|nr:phasin family protein [Rhizobacter sp.]
MFSADQMSAAQMKQVATMFDLTQKAFASVEKLVELNLQTARSVLEDATDSTLAIKDPQQFFAPRADVMQPVADKATAYGRQWVDIVTEAQSDVNQVAEAGVAQARAQWLAMVDTAVNNAPAGSENAAMMFKSGMVTANDAFDNVQRASKQAAEGLQANLMSLAPKTAAAPSKAKRAR